MPSYYPLLYSTADVMCSNSNHTDSFPCSSPTSSKPLCGFPFWGESVVSVRPGLETLLHHIFEAKPFLNNTHLVQKTWTYRQYKKITYSWSIDGIIQRTEKEISGEKENKTEKGVVEISTLPWETPFLKAVFPPHRSILLYCVCFHK